MIPVFVINLRESVERREHMKRTMGSAGIPFVFVEAVEKKDVTNNGGPLSRSQIACARSHLHAIGLIAQGDDEFGAVFEDDIFFLSQDGKQFLDAGRLRSLPRFDVLQLYPARERALFSREVGRIGSHAVEKRSRPRNGMVALIYHKDAAQRIVQTITDIHNPIDEMIFKQAGVFGLRILTAQPAVIGSGNFTSTVVSPEKCRRMTVPERVARELRRHFRRPVSSWVAWCRI